MARDTGIVDQDIHAAELLHHLLERLHHLRLAHRIGLHVQRPLPGGIQGIRHDLRRAGPIPRDHLRALCIATLGNPLAWPFPRPCDNHHQILHLVHGILLLLRGLC